MHFLSLLKSIPLAGPISWVISAYEIYTQGKEFIDSKVQERANTEIRLAKEEIASLFKGRFSMYLRYVGVNIGILTFVCFVGQVVEKNLLLLATGYAIITCRMILSARLIIKSCYTGYRKGQISFNINGSLYTILDQTVSERTDQKIRKSAKILRALYKLLRIDTTIKKVIAEGLRDTLRLYTLYFGISIGVAWVIYMVITHFYVLPLMEGTEGMNILLAHLYPFWKSICICAQELLSNPPVVVIFAIILCGLFARTTWLFKRCYGVTATSLLFLLFLSISFALFYPIGFSYIESLLFIQAFISIERCTTGHYLYPGLTG